MWEKSKKSECRSTTASHVTERLIRNHLFVIFVLFCAKSSPCIERPAVSIRPPKDTGEMTFWE